ncbi:hypothetical protein BHE74_00021791 [Ensete ventricosum]|nr:hypothetical protein BHE74_00021791 [Ensete ventricosum]
MAVVWLWGCRDASKRTHRGRATPWVSPALRSFLYYAGGGGGRRGPRLWPARAMIIIFGAGEKAEEAEGEGSGCNVKQGKGNYCVLLLIGADATVVVHEEDGLMHKDASAEE